MKEYKSKNLKLETNKISIKNPEIWKLWGIVGIFFIYFFYTEFEKQYRQDAYYLFLSRKYYLTARFCLGLGSIYIAFLLKKGRISMVEFDLKIWLYYVLGISFMFCAYNSIQWNSFEIEPPPLLYFTTIFLSVRTLKLYNKSKDLTRMQKVFQFSLIRKYWKKFILRMLMFLIVFIGLNELIDYIITQSNL